MGSNVIFLIVVSIIVADFLFSCLLDIMELKSSRSPIPSSLKDLYTHAAFRRQQSYLRYGVGVDIASSLVAAVVALLLFAFGGYALVDGYVREVCDSAILQGLLFWVVIYALEEVLSLPIDIYDVFHVEQKFGFNKSSFGLFIKDFFKDLLLDLIPLGAGIALGVFLYGIVGQWFWLIAWACLTLFNLFMDYFYSDLIVPLFNRQTPLPNGPLRTAIEEFAQKVDFPLDNIYVLDSSKRSSHANAYFTGFGKKKRIVLYDTLLEQLDTKEIVGVLSHEIGHYKHRDTIKDFGIELLVTFVEFYLFSLMIDSDAVALAAGCPEASFHVNLAVFMLIFTPLSVLFDIAVNAFSRKQERQADRFCIDNGMGHFQARALKKLSRESLDNLTPHPFVVFIEYSHPPLEERISYLEGRDAA